MSVLVAFALAAASLGAPGGATTTTGTTASTSALAAAAGARITATRSQYGRVVADRRGEALYLFAKEKRAKSECYGDCAKVWPPVLTKGTPRAGKRIRAGLLGTTRRRGGKLQVTYRGHPLYYFVSDSPGQILCHDVEEFGGRWLVVRPSGRAHR